MSLYFNKCTAKDPAGFSWSVDSDIGICLGYIHKGRNGYFFQAANGVNHFTALILDDIKDFLLERAQEDYVKELSDQSQAKALSGGPHL